MFLAVQGGEFLTLVGAAHDNRAFELVEVVGMHRLAEVKHHVVGHVHGKEWSACRRGSGGGSSQLGVWALGLKSLTIRA